VDSRRGLTTAITLLSVVLGACTITGEDYETDTPVAKRLQERLERFSREGPDGKRRRLADLTDFAWDTVYHFGGNDRYERVDAVVGETIFGRDGLLPDDFELLVFTRDENVVHAIGILPPVYLEGGKRDSYRRAQSALTAGGEDSGPYLLFFPGVRR